MPAPGWDQWQKCTANGYGDGSAPDGVPRAYFIEHFDAVNGVKGQQWSETGGVGSGQFSPTIEYDGMGNSSGIHHTLPASKRPSPGEVININIGGLNQGCHQYMGRGSSQIYPSPLFPSTKTLGNQGPPVPPGQDYYINPQEANTSMIFSNCFGCVYGATDPAGPGWGEEEEYVHSNYAEPDKPDKPVIIKNKPMPKERSRSGENEVRKELKEEVNRIKRLIGY
tara:strand:- start:3091 stop:3762 length:672 start_codon:yes stop_codon:yes gene_type:complete